MTSWTHAKPPQGIVRFGSLDVSLSHEDLVALAQIGPSEVIRVSHSLFTGTQTIESWNPPISEGCSQYKRNYPTGRAIARPPAPRIQRSPLVLTGSQCSTRPSRTSRESIAPLVRPCFAASCFGDMPASKSLSSALSSSGGHARPAFFGRSRSACTAGSGLTSFSISFAAKNNARITCGLLNGLCSGRISPVAGSMPRASVSKVVFASTGFMLNHSACLVLFALRSSSRSPLVHLKSRRSSSKRCL
jgi:hypothetical protein